MRKIAIDIDDVIADSTEALRLLVNTRLGVDLQTEHYRTSGAFWGYYERVWREHGIDNQISFKEVSSEMEIDQSHIPLLAGAAYALLELRKSNELVIITSRDTSWEPATRQWLDAQGLEDVELYFAGQHHAKETKGQLCKALGVDVLIDDNPDHCQSAIEGGLSAVLFGEYGWHDRVPGKVIHCKDWAAVLEYLND